MRREYRGRAASRCERRGEPEEEKSAEIASQRNAGVVTWQRTSHFAPVLYSYCVAPAARRPSRLPDDAHRHGHQHGHRQRQRHRQQARAGVALLASAQTQAQASALRSTQPSVANASAESATERTRTRGTRRTMTLDALTFSRGDCECDCDTNQCAAPEACDSSLKPQRTSRRRSECECECANRVERSGAERSASKRRHRE